MTPWAVNIRIEYQLTDAQELQERKCMGTLIANNVILTSSNCCENIRDFSIIDSSGGTNGQNNNTGKNVNKAGHLSNSVYGKSKSYQMCKWGQKKNGDCKKKGTGRRRKRDTDEDDYADMICVLNAPFNVADEFVVETIKERLKYPVLKFQPEIKELFF